MLYKTLYLPLTPYSVKQAEQGIISGYASVFGLRDLQGDIVRSGAFTASLNGWKSARAAPAMLWQHHPKSQIGNWLSLKEDSIGLYVSGALNLATKRGRDAQAHISSGAVRGLSIGYLIEKQHYSPSQRARILERIALHEISLVSTPANPAAKLTPQGRIASSAGKAATISTPL